MKGKLIAVGAALAVVLAVAVPAIARTGTHSRHAVRLVMAGSPRPGHSLKGLAFTATGPFGESHYVASGFACEVVVATGPTGHVFRTFWTHDSSEFYSVRTVNGQQVYSVTGNCVGSVPAGIKTFAGHIVHTITIRCGLLDPLDTTKFVDGSGMTTTFKERLYSESCSIPALTLP